jgi:hypothetical protein
MAQRTEYILHSHLDPSIQTIGDFIKDGGSIGLGLSARELLLYKDENDTANYKNIITGLISQDPTQFEELGNSLPSIFKFENFNSATDEQLESIPLPIGTILALPIKNLDFNLGIIEGNQVIDYLDLPAFVADSLVKLISSNPDFRSETTTDDGFVVTNSFPQISVWVWSRALSKIMDNKSDTYDDKLINLSPFIDSMNSSMTKNGGSFSFSIASIVSQFKDGNWEIDPSFNLDNIFTSFINTYDSKKFKPLEFLFNNILQNNDVVFIKSHSDNFIPPEDFKFFIPSSELVKENFEMIGLIDGLPHNSQFVDTNTSIKGRDLIKLIIEDGNYYYPFDYVEGGIFSNVTGATQEKLLRFNGDYLSRFQGSFKTIASSLKFIINTLSTLAITSDTLFYDYKDRRSQAYQIPNPDSQQINQPRVLQPVRGIWQIVKLLIDQSVAYRRIADQSIGNEIGPLINSFRKICQEPFVEFFGDTYQNQYYFIVRKPPFDRESILSYIQGIVTSQSETESIAQVKPQGVEINNLKGQSFFEEEQNNAFNLPKIENYEVKQDLTLNITPVVIDIEEHEIYSSALNYSNEIYSWYKLKPQGLTQGGRFSQMSISYLKAIFFPEFADIYGSKPLDITTNYINFVPLNDKHEVLNTANFIRQGMIDLKYLIDTHCYLPFTKEGTISIIYNSKIKRANFIRRVSTGEIFYVDSVTNDFQKTTTTVNKETTLQVSRGMVEKYIKGVNIQGVNYSYFNICNTDIPSQIFNNPDLDFIDLNKQVTANWKVNKSVFNFFIKRMQFAEIKDLNLQELPTVDVVNNDINFTS